MSQFEWDRLGDIATGRENLGEDMPVVVYRLLQYTLMDEMTEKLGLEQAEALMRGAGYRAGRAFAQNLLDTSLDFHGFEANLKNTLKDLKIGVLRIEKADIENLDLVLTVSEDLDCSGLPVTGDGVCVYDEGFIAGILEQYSGKPFQVREIDCWATGDRTCRFTAKGEL